MISWSLRAAISRTASAEDCVNQPACLGGDLRNRGPQGTATGRHPGGAEAQRRKMSLGRQQGRAPDQGYRGKGGIDQEAQGGQAQRRDYRPPSGINPPDVLRGAETTSRTMLKVLPACVASTQRKKTSNLGLLAPRYPSHTYTYKEISFISFEELAHPPAHVQILRPKTNQGTTRCPPGKDRLHALSWLAAKRDCRKIWLDLVRFRPEDLDMGGRVG